MGRGALGIRWERSGHGAMEKTRLSHVQSHLIPSNLIWVNYNDLTVTSLESWLVREIIPK